MCSQPKPHGHTDVTPRRPGLQEHDENIDFPVSVSLKVRVCTLSPHPTHGLETLRSAQCWTLPVMRASFQEGSQQQCRQMLHSLKKQ